MSLLYDSTCFEYYVLIIRRSKLYYTASGIITPVGGRSVHRLREAICGSPVFATVLLRDPLHRGVMGFAMQCIVLIFRRRSDQKNDISTLDDEGATLFRKVGIRILSDEALHSNRTEL